MHQLRLGIVKWIVFGEASTELNIEEIPSGYIVTVLAVKYLLNVSEYSCHLDLFTGIDVHVFSAIN